MEAEELEGEMVRIYVGRRARGQVLTENQNRPCHFRYTEAQTAHKEVQTFPQQPTKPIRMPHCTSMISLIYVIKPAGRWVVNWISFNLHTSEAEPGADQRQSEARPCLVGKCLANMSSRLAWEHILSASEGRDWLYESIYPRYPGNPLYLLHWEELCIPIPLPPAQKVPTPDTQGTHCTYYTGRNCVSPPLSHLHRKYLPQIPRNPLYLLHWEELCIPIPLPPAQKVPTPDTQEPTVPSALEGNDCIYPPYLRPDSQK
ncbi:hypothetical protein XELAEV_18044201mg [Xenopus laevis]|uniref:Uncharacterized protein n=1 Tax=Xenopus laevis TaxID=8355 RepID=A0A974BZ31_XENLA|nr:hypothetical protein XELAEV_18044201mg [Xenopus laevis]